MTGTRKYSVAEIDRMRYLLRLGRVYGANIEGYLRTYMLNGTDPSELEPAAIEKVTDDLVASGRSPEIARELARRHISLGQSMTELDVWEKEQEP